jgi:hypothetical protein
MEFVTVAGDAESVLLQKLTLCKGEIRQWRITTGRGVGDNSANIPIIKFILFQICLFLQVYLEPFEDSSLKV